MITNKVIKAIAYLICYTLYPFSFLIPRTRKIQVYGSFHGSFADNAKYAFIDANEQGIGMPIWLSTRPETALHIRSLGYRAYWIGHPAGIWYALRAKFWFVNAYTSDIAFFLSGGATIINLWHGLPWKCIEFGIRKGTLAKRYNRTDRWEVFTHPACFIRPDYVLSASDKITEIFARSFRITKEQCLPFGYPRNALLTRSKEDVLTFIRRYESQETLALTEQISKFKQVYIYMPTWRDSQRDLFAGGMDLERLNTVMQAKQAVLLLKPHPNTRIPVHKEYSNLVFVNSQTDVYCILPLTDVLITDYSSVMFDYPLMPCKGMILYQYDYEEYIRDREFNFPLEGNIIGKKVSSFEQLVTAIAQGEYTLSEVDRSRFIATFWGDHLTQNASSQIFQFVSIP